MKTKCSNYTQTGIEFLHHLLGTLMKDRSDVAMRGDLIWDLDSVTSSGSGLGSAVC